MSDKNILHAISGGLSGLVSMAVTYPLVTLSTTAQASDNLETVEVKAPENLEHDESMDGKSIPGKLKLLLKKVLFRVVFLIKNSKKYYSGLESALIGIVAVNFTYYYVYSLVSNYFKKYNRINNGLNVKQSLITGLTAGVVSRIITNPIWVANTRMTVKAHKFDEAGDEKKNSSTLKVMYDIFKDEGVSGLFSGIGPALILVTSPMIQFTVFEQLKNFISRLRHKEISSKEALLLGSFGKLVAILVTYPYYTIRSRMHLNMTTKNENSFHVLFNMIKKEGVSSLYRGMNAKLLQSVLSAGLIFYFKEEMMILANYLTIRYNRKSN
ncbi:hypothetical protein CANINC_002664 [Pichia inconspicua]|uniref:Mitochondrial carrier protein n=1 Tax=Pichia inconspicua TaxID=52247 RepID=A0A4T0X0I9_9ASCO|nr:hypothetical protein CANINC_002664 [[Candida] inconspicua]